MQYNSLLRNFTSEQVTDLSGKKILFATFPADGHFNPLTGLAAYLQEQGADVRWYTSVKYASKLAQLGIPHYGLRHAVDISDPDTSFPERAAIKGQLAKLKFDIIHAFIMRGPEYYRDLVDIQSQFPFEIVVADCAFTGVPFITDRMKVPVISIGVFPLTENSVDLPPAGLGMMPSYTALGRLKQATLRWLADKVIFHKPNRIMRAILEEHGIDHLDTNVFDLLVKKSSLLLQSGTPGFEYYRSDLGQNIRFVGALLPYQGKKKLGDWQDERLNRYEKIIIATQGTVEKDVEKLLVPALEAFKDSDTLLIVTTGGSGTADLRKRYPQANLIIEDYIPFADIMPYADAYLTNGGYGGVMLGIEHELPLIVAGVHEGKNEINARIGYFELGINLKTEWPKPQKIREAFESVLNNKTYKANVSKLAREFRQYRPNERCARYVGELLDKVATMRGMKPGKLEEVL